MTSSSPDPDLKPSTPPASIHPAREDTSHKDQTDDHSPVPILEPQRPRPSRLPATPRPPRDIPRMMGLIRNVKLSLAIGAAACLFTGCTHAPKQDAQSAQSAQAPTHAPALEGESKRELSEEEPVEAEEDAELSHAPLQVAEFAGDIQPQGLQPGKPNAKPARRLALAARSSGAKAKSLKSSARRRMSPARLAKRTARPASPNAQALAVPVPPPAQHPAPVDRERYAHSQEQPFHKVTDRPLSTFSVDVDTASYSNVRRMLRQGQAIPDGAVRIEEMLNYFSYDYPAPKAHPFSVTTEVASAPWAPEHQLVMVGIQGKRVAQKAMPPRNLVFLLDVSGSMSNANKLPLLKRSFNTLLDTLGHKDRVAIVVYAGASGVVLPMTRATQRQEITKALGRLAAGGSTNGGAGIEMAYRLAEQAKQPGSVNRVILATDGDFNVGVSNQSELVRLIEKKRKTGISLTVLGFGMGNYADSTLEQLADKGDGNYAYIDSFKEAKKVLLEEASGTLLTIAKDVKIQVEFNPSVVGAYRLIGYDNRRLASRDFNDDKKDAGDIGAGHTVTALYELLTPDQAKQLSGVDALKYQKPASPIAGATEMLNIKLRYKLPGQRKSKLIQHPVQPSQAQYQDASDNFRFASAVAAFGMLLKQSKYGGQAAPRMVSELATGALGKDPRGHRKEFLSLTTYLGKAAALRAAR